MLHGLVQTGALYEVALEVHSTKMKVLQHSRDEIYVIPIRNHSLYCQAFKVNDERMMRQKLANRKCTR